MTWTAATILTKPLTEWEMGQRAGGSEGGLRTGGREDSVVLRAEAQSFPPENSAILFRMNLMIPSALAVP